MGKLIIGSVIILLPVAAGLILWDRLPGVFASHWNASGEANGFAGKGMMIFGLPLILLAFQWLCVLATAADPKNKNQSPKAFNLVLWILPVLSVVISAITYSIALGAELNMTSLMSALLGVMFILIGNYLPKCRVNHTIGIKLPWTINDEEVWNRTHRFASWFWVAGGILMITASFIASKWAIGVMVAVLILLVIIPTVYSYVIFKKKGGTLAKASERKSPFIILSIVLSAVVLAAAGVVMFTGSVYAECAEDSLSVKATYWEKIRVDYDMIDSVEYRDSFDGGERTSGFGSAKLLCGTFRNEEFGYYTRYTETGNKGFVVMDVDGKKLVIGLESKEQTKALYEEILNKTA